MLVCERGYPMLCGHAVIIIELDLLLFVLVAGNCIAEVALRLDESALPAHGFLRDSVNLANLLV